MPEVIGKTPGRGNPLQKRRPPAGKFPAAPPDHKAAPASSRATSDFPFRFAGWVPWGLKGHSSTEWGIEWNLASWSWGNRNGTGGSLFSFSFLEEWA